MLAVNVFRPVMGVTPMTTRFLSTSSILLKKKTDPTLPEIPKGAPTAYTLWFKEHVAKVSPLYRRPDGKLDMHKLAIEAAPEWASLSSTLKGAFQERATEARKVADKAYLKFWNSTNPEIRSAIEKSTGKKLKAPGGKKAYRQSIAERPGNPGKPLAPYFAFIKDVRESGKLDKLGLDLDGRERSKALAREYGVMWNALSSKEQQVYKDKYHADKVKYDAWKTTQSDLSGKE
ncbi:uncharacterized protein L203_103806 [Cryptococcus depauperatus CBS 7841]|uniref:Uncharacterized protein n=1 Tax=Cryptococcus depauperatus CBS 7841 TaxID=1295531 RepID=A0A1E3IE68_9TREE|nr:hypothetical protein L203_03695 [Cryptococcus depauperatus CBS 7841]